MRLSILLLLSLTGCQTLGLSEAYMDGIDRIPDRAAPWDVLYSPAYDLTRIGRPDWCSYPLNHALCPCRCSQQQPPVCNDYPLMVSHVSATMPGTTPSNAEPEPESFREPYSRPNSDYVTPSVPKPPQPELPAPPEPEPEVQQMTYNWAQPVSQPVVVPAAAKPSGQAVLRELGLQPSTPVIPVTPIEPPAMIPVQSEVVTPVAPQPIAPAQAGTLPKNSRGRVVAPRPEGPARPVWAKP